MNNLTSRLRRWLEPPVPYVLNPREQIDAPLGRWNLYLGGAGCRVDGSINVDVLAGPGVDVIADGHALPFPEDSFQRVECDAVLEHVRDPRQVMDELRRVVAPGGYVHVVTPFCHPFHRYPEDYHRFTLDGLKLYAGGLEVVAEGWRSGPAATLLITILEFGKLLLPWHAWRVAAHGILGWALFPLRYLDLALIHRPEAGRIGNHCYLWLRKPPTSR